VGGKVIVISGHTASRTPDWPKYHAAFHISAPDLAKLAAQTNVKGEPAEQVIRP